MSVTVSEQLPLLAAAPNGIKKLRELILELAVRGKLVAQDAGDEPASELLKRIAVEKQRLVAEGRVKSPKLLSTVAAYKEPAALPMNWECVRLGDVVDVLDSLRRPVTKQDRKAGPYPYYGASGIVDHVSNYIFDEPLVLVGEDGARWGAGDRTAFQVSGKTWVNNHAHVVRPHRPLLLDSYLVVALVGMDLSSFITGTTVPKLNQAKLVSIRLPLPPLAEQNRIVAKVDELMALCDQLETQQADAESAHAQLVAALLGSLTQTGDSDDFAASWQRLSAHFHTLFTTESSIDALKQTLLQLAVMGKLVPQDSSDEAASELVKRIQAKKFNLLDESKARKQKELATGSLAEPPYEAPSSWEWQTVDSVLHVTGGITLGRKLTGRKLISKPYLRVANVQRGHLDLYQIKEIEVPEDEAEKYLLRDGDLLITEGGDWDKVGRTAIWRSELPECLHQNHVFRARAVTTEWEPRWAEMYLNAAPARDYFAGSSKQTTNLASINMTQLRGCAFPIPPLAEQHRIVTKVDQLMSLCDKLSAAIQRRNQHSRHLADALVDKALSPVSRTNANVVDLSCYLVDRLVDKPTFGRTTHMKLIYLADTHLGFNFQGEYMREAAGPLDKNIYQVEKQAEARGWYTHTSAPLKSGVEKITYHATDMLAAKARQVAETLGDRCKDLDRLIALLGDRKTDDVQIVATLFAAWNDAMLDGQSPSDDWIIREVRENWHAEKQRFTAEKLGHWLDWMRKHHLVPTGKPPRTQHQGKLL